MRRMARPTKSKRDKTRDPEEYKRFLETAREVAAEEDPTAFERAFRKVAKPAERKKGS